MRTIVHLSDLHFGRVHPATLDPLRRAVAAIQPDLVAVSGDLTQRARTSQFRDARAFLDTLPTPQIVVPGNHDVPLYNLALRFGRPYARFQRFIEENLSPSFVDDEVAVLGINTARALVTQGGRVNVEQVLEICERFGALAGTRTKVVVTHHPFDLPPGIADRNLVGRSRAAMLEFAKCGVDLFLAGHLHRIHRGGTERYAIQGYSALVVQAGTATSNRGRGEENSFNLIRIERPRITIETHTWEPGALTFALTESREFRHSDGEGWLPA